MQPAEVRFLLCSVFVQEGFKLNWVRSDGAMQKYEFFATQRIFRGEAWNVADMWQRQEACNADPSG